MFAVLMAIWLLGCTAFQFHPRTREGLQCPTAVVQTVKEPVYCCGEVVGYTERAPQPGESSFVQCRCAEKKAADHALSMPPKLEAFPAPRFVFEVPVALAPVWTVHPYTREFESWTVPPPTPPPA
ncbi:MAG: hypothetical protein BGO01_00310 [Armatimonadetes bacterium 55-13]|nr:MAG: hypothetical protein ABT09_03060 [bacterium SCN 57-13]OJU63143.1 MAG: hypothetical protein BGO01_00310 [Armatimonadetes bacterium 55-13]